MLGQSMAFRKVFAFQRKVVSPCAFLEGKGRVAERVA
jgi:hypothetical protein